MDKHWNKVYYLLNYLCKLWRRLLMNEKKTSNLMQTLAERLLLKIFKKK